MPADLRALLDALASETAWLEGLLAPLDAADWQRVTPAPGWRIQDQIAHLAFFDEAATTALVDPERFRADAARAATEAAAAASAAAAAAGAAGAAAAGNAPGEAEAPGLVDAVTARFASLAPADVMAWFGRARSAMVEAFAGADPSARVPWYGPAMSVASSLTPRIMETWAHGQDVADALGAEHPVSAALDAVVHIGVRALPNSFRARGLAVPEVGIRVELVAPDRRRWDFGDSDATERVRGPAIDFALVVTQRRHVDDTALVADGPVAAQWLRIAQAFAGPPGAGRAPGARP